MKRIWSIIPTAGAPAYTLSAALLIISLAVSGAGIAVALAAPLNAPFTPAAVSFEGQLADSSGNAVPDDSYPLKFTLYNSATDSAPANIVWTETQASVPVKGGLYSVLLGADPVNLLPGNTFDGPRWLGVKIGTDPEMTPRVPVGAVPFALNARQTQGLQAYPVSAAAPQNGQVLTFNGSQWAPAAPPSAPFARVRRATDLSITSNLWTSVPFEEARWPTAMFNPATSTRLTVPTDQGGKYLITGSIVFAGDSSQTGQRGILIQFLTAPGTTPVTIAFDFRNAPNCAASACTGPVRLSISTVYAMAANNFVELQVYQDSGSPLLLKAVANYAPEFSMVRIGD